MQATQNQFEALLKVQTMGQSMNTPDFLDWIADRMIHVYDEHPETDFIISLRERADAGRAALELINS